MKNFLFLYIMMSDKDLNVDENVVSADLSSVTLDELVANQDASIQWNSAMEAVTADQMPVESATPDLSWVVEYISNTETEPSAEWELDNSKLEWVSFDEGVQIDQPNQEIFLWETGTEKVKDVDDEWSKMGKYLRILFTCIIVTVLAIVAMACFISFNKYLSKASQPTIDSSDVEFVNTYKEWLSKIKGFLWKNNKDNYSSPNIKSQNLEQDFNNIIKANDIDFIEKKDLLTSSAASLVSSSESDAIKIDQIKQDIAKQWFLPAELESILTEDVAISTIQRSLNALEVIKFSTAANVFSYMNTALSNIAEMIRIGGVSVDKISQLLTTVASRGEKDVSAYVYLCYLNPFETNADCDNIKDLDRYYEDIIKDDAIDLTLFKNVMNAINQLLENEDTAMFAITFNGFNAQSKDITFNIEVYTNQNDEKVLIAQWKRNPNIFILTNIINLLKQSSFIIWAEINTKTVNVETKSITMWWVTSIVNYSSQDFTVPIQRDTEREIFDYIDLDSVMKLVDNKSTKE